MRYFSFSTCMWRVFVSAPRRRCKRSPSARPLDPLFRQLPDEFQHIHVLKKRRRGRVAFAWDDLDRNLSAARLVALLEQLGVLLDRHGLVRIAMDDEHRHLLVEERPEVIERVVATHLAKHLLLGYAVVG